MATFRDAVLPALDAVRGIPGILGLRLFTVSITRRSWAGARVGFGTSTDATAGLKVDLGIYQTKITQVSSRDIVASGGLYTAQDLKVGPITPVFAGSGADNSAITVFDSIPNAAAPAEIFFNVKGPGFPTNGGFFKKIGQDVTKSFQYSFVIRRTAQIP